jgi:hypothetical protein
MMAMKAPVSFDICANPYEKAATNMPAKKLKVWIEELSEPKTSTVLDWKKLSRT